MNFLQKDKIYFKSNHKGFTLIELLVIIAIIGVLTTVAVVALNSARDSAKEVRGVANQKTASSYCGLNPGVSELHGDTVFCDEKSNMWSITLNSGGTFVWGPTSDLPAYANGDCNNLTAADKENYPACNACHNLDYAGFDSGWRLPTQGRITSGVYCNAACGRDCNYYHAFGRQLWDFGRENCPAWGTFACSASQGSCTPTWDTSAVAYRYWSSLQHSATSAWYVNFHSGGAGTGLKSGAYRVRCFLGQN